MLKTFPWNPETLWAPRPITPGLGYVSKKTIPSISSILSTRRADAFVPPFEWPPAINLFLSTYLDNQWESSDNLPLYHP